MFIHQNACRKYVIIPNWIFLISGKKVENAKETHRERCASWVWSVYNKRHVICVPLQFRGYSLQTSTPKEKQPTSGCGFPSARPLPPPLPLTRPQPVVISLLHVCMWNRKREKGPRRRETREKTWHYRFTAGPSFQVPLPLDSTAVVANLLTGCRSWHDMFPQQAAASSSPPWIKSNQWADAVWLELWYCLIAQRLSLTHTVVSITAWFTGTIPHMQATPRICI